MAVVHLMAQPDDDDKRAKALTEFCNATGLPPLRRIVQRGRGAEAAYTFEFEDGRKTRIGTINTLWSLTELSKILTVSIGVPLPALKPASWYTLRTKLLEKAIEVDETPGDTFADIVRDWLGKYCERAGKDRDGAAVSRLPFIEGDSVYVYVTSFAKEIRRHYSASVKEKELMTALEDLGFERRTIMYNKGSKRSSASYYVASVDALTPEDVFE